MFSNIFNMDNAFWRFMTRVADIFILNVLCILFSLPIVTIGASVTALYTVTLKMVNDEEAYIAKGFWQAFKSNFKQSTIIWLIMLFVGIFLGVDIFLCLSVDSSFMKILFYVFIVIAVVYTIILSYVFPLQSKFENTILNTIKNSALMGIAHLIPWTLLIVVLNVLPIAVLFFFTGIFLAFGFPIMLLCGFAVIAYVNSKIFNRVFKRYIPGKEDESTEENEAAEEMEVSEETNAIAGSETAEETAAIEAQETIEESEISE